MKPGIYPDMSNEAYHAAEGESKSSLVQYMKSPAHWQEYRRQQKEPRSQKGLDALRFGTLSHLAVLEPEKFTQVPTFKGSRRAGKQWDEFFAANGKNYIRNNEHGLISQMAEKVFAHEKAAVLLTGPGVIEESCIWIDPHSGEVCKTRPDRRRFNGVAVDYKTCKDATPYGFAKAMADHGYHIQAAMCIDGYKAHDIEITHFVFIAQEKTAPFNVEVYSIDQRAIDLGEMEYKEALLNFSQSKIENNWPGYTAGAITNLDLPAWKYGG